jgi:hypothetical protein
MIIDVFRGVCTVTANTLLLHALTSRAGNHLDRSFRLLNFTVEPVLILAAAASHHLQLRSDSQP